MARRNITSDNSDAHDRKTGDMGGRTDNGRINLFLLGTPRNLVCTNS